MTLRLTHLTVLILFVGALPANAESMLRHDPFVRPQLSASANHRPGDPVLPMEAVGGEWSPQLSSAMMAGKDSMVTVDGVILRLGEEINGYRLLRVRDHEAVFQKGGKKIVLKMGTTVLKSNIDRISQ